MQRTVEVWYSFVYMRQLYLTRVGGKHRNFLSPPHQGCHMAFRYDMKSSVADQWRSDINFQTSKVKTQQLDSFLSPFSALQRVCRNSFIACPCEPCGRLMYDEKWCRALCGDDSAVSDNSESAEAWSRKVCGRNSEDVADSILTGEWRVIVSPMVVNVKLQIACVWRRWQRIGTRGRETRKLQTTTTTIWRVRWINFLL